jgi:methionyl-tRNA formyltransferase
MMDLIFMGTPDFAVPSLRTLIEAGYTIKAVFTQPDRPAGRKQTITPSPVKLLAAQCDIAIFQPEKIKNAAQEFEPLFREADAGIVAAYGRILPDWMLAAPRHGCINVHSSLLPSYRGAAPINWAIANGERETGVTIMQMDSGLDTGDILLQRSTEIGDEETAEELTPRLAEMGAVLLIETLGKLERGELTPVPQDDDKASLAPILKREDGLVDWEKTAQEVFNRWRGFKPFPGCFTLFGGQRLELVRVIVEATDHTSTEFQPGTVYQIAKDHFTVSCGRGTLLRVTEVQPAGKRQMKARDFLNGTSLGVGDRLGS